MCPELFHVGPLPIRTWGLMLALTFLAGLYFLKRVGKRDDRDFEIFLTIAYIMIIGGVIGARLSYVLLHLSEFSGNIGAIVNPFQSGQFGIAGLNLYGGILVAIGGAYLYCKIKKLPVLDIFDYFAPTLALGIGISRIGCFLNGCCFGTPTDLPWGITFPVGSIPFMVYGYSPLHPAQIYSSLYGLALFVWLHFMLKRRRFVGQLVAVLFVAEAILRFLIEYVRYYEDAMFFSFAGTEPTYNQVVSLALFIAGIVIYFLKRNDRIDQAPASAD